MEKLSTAGRAFSKQIRAAMTSTTMLAAAQNIATIENSPLTIGDHSGTRLMMTPSAVSAIRVAMHANV
jgi:hypothetical protein